MTRDQASAQKAADAGVGAHRLEKPPIADQMHVVLWVIKANDIRFEMGKYREIIKFVEHELSCASKYTEFIFKVHCHEGTCASFSNRNLKSLV